MSDSLQERGRSMEDAFFRDLDQKLIDRMKADMSRKEAVESLRKLSGISDSAVLEKLVSQGVHGGTLVSLALIPLVSVAWADGQIQPNEREAIMRAANENAIDKNTPAYELLESWLQKRPGSELLETWRLWMQSIKASQEPAVFNQMKTVLLNRAREVASVAGGFLGIAAVSESEKRVLEDLEKSV